jgi:glycosyltransferase involved in cell wall biosynthesis
VTVRTVLHVLPHPGGGGERYVDTLSRMEGYRFERVYLAPSPSPGDALRKLPRSWWSTFRRADLLHVHGEVAAAMCLPVLAARRSVVTFHGLNLLRRSAGFRRRAAIANLRLVVRASTASICVAESEAEDVRAALGRGDDSIVTIVNGVDIPALPDESERAEARAEFGLSEETVAGAWIGGLEAVKDPLTAVSAAVTVAKAGVTFCLLVAGDGPLLPSASAAADEGPPGAVRLLGFQKDVRRVLAAADVFVLSSLREGMSYALLDAMALGLPPVVSDVPGNVEAVGQAGFFARRGSPEEFARAFELMSVEATRRELGLQARARVSESFLADDAVKKTRNLYEQLSGA